MPGVVAVAPVHRATADVSGRNATVLAVDTREAADGLLLRPDLAGTTAPELLAPLAPAAGPRPGLALPAGTRALAVDLRAAAPAGSGASRVTAVLEDPSGVPYRQTLGTLPSDDRPHRLALDLGALTGASGGGASGGDGPRGSGGLLTLTGLELDGLIAEKPHHIRTVRVERLATTGTDGGTRTHSPAKVLADWSFGVEQTESDGGRKSGTAGGDPGPAGTGGTAPYAVSFGVDGTHGDDDDSYQAPKEYALRMAVPAPKPPARLPAVATRAFMAATGAGPGDTVEVTVDGLRLPVVVGRVVEELPTTGPAAPAASAGRP